MSLQLAEIQGIVLSGYGDRPCAQFSLFAIDDVARARAWLGRLVGRIQFADFLSSGRDEDPLLANPCINVAFSYAGCARLGLAKDTLLGFSGPFRSGMSAPHRARQLDA